MIWEYSQFWSQLLLFSPLICVCVSIMVQIKDQKIKSLFSLVWNQNDSKSVQEIDLRLRQMDPVDPVKYDYALFGLGVHEKF